MPKASSNRHFKPSLKRLLACLSLRGFIVVGLLLLALGILSPRIDLLARPLLVPNHLQKADVIIAVSAGLLSHCEAHPNLFRREIYAAKLWRAGYSRSHRLIISGVYSRPPFSPQRCQQRMANLLGVPMQALIIDNQAHTTLENARNSREIMRRHGWKNAVLVTSHSHMFRALHTFEKQGIPVYPVQVPDVPAITGVLPDANHLAHIRRFLYEYGALLKYKWYGYL